MEKTDQKISHQGIINIWETHRGKGSVKPSKRIKQLAKKRRQTAPKTKAEKQLATVKRKKLDTKRVLNMTEKKLAKLEGTDEQPTSISDNLDFNVV